jgi:hypothetical protein
VIGCSHTRPFAKQGDLDRHLASVHKVGPTFKCPRLDCKRHERGFPRKDKLKHHINTLGHGSFHCPYDHCDYQQAKGFLSREILGRHVISWDHGVYECGVGSCKGTTSCFNPDILALHLADHGLFTSEAKILIENLPLRGGVVGDSEIEALGSDSFVLQGKVVVVCENCAKLG